MRSLTREQLEATIDAVRQCNGSRREAAAKLGVTVFTVYNRLAQAAAIGFEVPAVAKRGRKPLGVKAPTPKRVAKVAAPSVAVVERPINAAPRPSYRFATVNQKREGWKEYVSGGRLSMSLRNALLESETINLQRLAFRVSRQLAGRIDADDLTSEGAIALIDAAKRYDPLKSSFWTFASQRALGAMLDLARRCDPVSRRVRVMERARKAFEASFRKTNGREPSLEEACRELEWTQAKYKQSFPPTSMSADTVGIESESGRTDPFKDTLAACDDGPDGHSLSESFFRRMCEGLPFDLQICLYLYYVRESTMKNIATAFGISEGRVSQQMTLAKKLLAEKLRHQRAA